MQHPLKLTQFLCHDSKIVQWLVWNENEYNLVNGYKRICEIVLFHWNVKRANATEHCWDDYEKELRLSVNGEAFQILKEFGVMYFRCPRCRVVLKRNREMQIIPMSAKVKECR